MASKSQGSARLPDGSDVGRVRKLIEAESRHVEERERDQVAGPFVPRSVEISRGHGRSKVLQVRLNEDEFELLRNLAAEQYLPASTLARSILLKVLES